jgi:hypothetical protein
MGKHDARGHALHISKRLKFKEPAPALSETPATHNAPQEPKPGTTAKNQYR